LTDDEIPTIIKAVLPIGNESITLDLETFEVLEQNYQYRDEIQKKSGAAVPTKAFQDEKYSGVTGIAFSTAELWNRPASFGEDFIFICNPLSTQKIDKDWLRIGKCFWVEDGQLRCKAIA
jgi:hypothetical protein